MEGCIFCSIVDGSVKSFKIYEDERYIAILDKFPNIEGQTLVIPKRHIESYAFSIDDSDLSEFIITTKRVAKLLERGLGVSRVHLVLEGTEIDHLHAKLYPAIGIGNRDNGIGVTAHPKPVKFSEYPGYITTISGKEADDKYLGRVRDRILSGTS